MVSYDVFESGDDQFEQVSARDIIAIRRQEDLAQVLKEVGVDCQLLDQLLDGGIHY